MASKLRRFTGVSPTLERLLYGLDAHVYVNGDRLSS